MVFLKSRAFTMEDQERFAKASLDRNPMHLDAVASRRTQAGAPVVHGMHALLWTLDELAAGGYIQQPVREITAEFRKFLYVGDIIAIRIATPDSQRLRVGLYAGDVELAGVSVGFGGSAECIAPFRFDPVDVPETPLVPSSEAIETAHSAVGLDTEARNSAYYPHASSAIGAKRVEGIARLSTIVGMLCPGLHSILYGLDLRFDDSPEAAVSYRCERFDARFGRISLAISGAGLSGSIVAFSRDAPVHGPAMSELRTMIDSEEFSSARALVIGGSRGLGEVTAKAIVAGGGLAVATYVLGEDDARRVANEIGGGACTTMRYDVRKPAAEQLDNLPWVPTQLYYFATPKIFQQKTPSAIGQLSRQFADYYVRGFGDLVAALLDRGLPSLRVFYPSSSAIDEARPEMKEYASAKAAGEALCAQLGRSNSRLTIMVRRLPRLRTDQTSTVLRTAVAEDATTVMLPILREMNRMTPGHQAPPA